MEQVKKKPVPCLLDTWAQTETSLYHWLKSRCLNDDLAFDLLQETFLKALQRETAFCDINNQKAWLFTVAKNLLIDEWRKSDRFESFEGDGYQSFVDMTTENEPIDGLAQCLPKALACLNEEDRAVLEFCDLLGNSQQEFANRNNLSLTAVKSRIQRARPKLRSQLKINCQIRFDDSNKVCCFTPSKTS